jgi:hypothetical protein
MIIEENDPRENKVTITAKRFGELLKAEERTKRLSLIMTFVVDNHLDMKDFDKLTNYLEVLLNDHKSYEEFCVKIDEKYK